MRAFRRGFTLIEMLLVVSIIALLIAILLPSLTKSRDIAREVSCRANMGQIARGTLGYAGDYQGQFPANRFRPNPILNEHLTWRALVVNAKYVSGGDLWVCPGPAERLPPAETSCHASTCIGDVRANYAYNGAAFWRFSPNGAPDGSHPSATTGIPNEKSELTLRNVRRRDLTFILLETQASFPDLGDWCVTWGDNSGTASIGYWHRRGANWAITDGSVKWSRLIDTGKTDCWWHNIAEPVGVHIAWESQLAALANNPHRP